MKRFIIEHSDGEFYTSTSGISLVGLSLNRFTNLTSSVTKAVPLSHGISHADVIRSFCALLAQGKSDFVAIEQHREDDFSREHWDFRKFLRKRPYASGWMTTPQSFSGWSPGQSSSF